MTNGNGQHGGSGDRSRGAAGPRSRRRNVGRPKERSPLTLALAVGVPLGLGIVVAALILPGPTPTPQPPPSPGAMPRDGAGSPEVSRPRGYSRSQLEAASNEELRLELKACDKAAKEWAELSRTTARRGEVLAPEAEAAVARLKAYQLRLVTVAMGRKSIAEAAAKAAQEERWEAGSPPQGRAGSGRTPTAEPSRSEPAAPDVPSLGDRQARADAEHLAELLAGVDEAERRFKSAGIPFNAEAQRERIRRKHAEAIAERSGRN